MEFTGRKKVATQLNIAPLIDVIFLLLLFFMLSANFITQRGIKVTLPAAVTAKAQPQENIIISLTADGTLYLNEENMTLAALPDKVKTKLAAAQKKTVIIKADEKTDLGLAVKVMDIAKQAQAEGLVISTQTVKNGRQ